MKYIDTIQNGNTTEVIYAHKGKVYTGVSQCHPDDKMFLIFGGTLAEQRAVQERYKDQLKQFKEDYKAVERFIKSCNCCKNFDDTTKEGKVIYHQLNVLKKNIKNLEDQIKYFNELINTEIKERDKYLTKLEKLRKEKEEKDKKE